MRGGSVLLALLLAACGHRIAPPAPVASPHYVIGPAYQLGGTWSYPEEHFQYVATGVAEREGDRRGTTVDGEIADPTAMAGAHRTLQLPAIVDVTNLANGRQIRIRLNDRGPAKPGRLVGLTPRAADLLGMPPGAAAPVRVEVDDRASQALRDQLGGSPVGVVAAPVTAVRQEALPAPGAARMPAVATVTPVAAPASVTAPVLERLPETVRQGPAQPGQLWIRAGQFTQARYAEALRAKLSASPARIQREGGGRGPGYVVMVGPFASVAAADAALDQVRASGVTDASIVVE